MANGNAQNKSSGSTAKLGMEGAVQVKRNIGD
jgi:hypothetical protein